MVTKLAFGACALALATISGSGTVDEAHAGPRSVVLRASAPVGVGSSAGCASLTAAIAGTRWRIAAAWSSRGERTRLGVAIVNERAD